MTSDTITVSIALYFWLSQYKNPSCFYSHEDGHMIFICREERLFLVYWNDAYAVYAAADDCDMEHVLHMTKMEGDLPLDYKLPVTSFFMLHDGITMVDTGTLDYDDFDNVELGEFCVTFEQA